MTDEAYGTVGGDGVSLPYESGIDLGSMLLTLARYAFVTFVVLLLFWVFMHLLRRALERASGPKGQGRIRVVESTRLCGDKLLHIVRIDNKEVLVGSSKENLSYLGELEIARAEALQSAGQELEDAGFDSGDPQRFADALTGVSLLTRQIYSRLSESAIIVASRAKDAVQRLRSRRSGHDGDQSSGDQILRDGARRVNEGTRRFRDVFREEVAASAVDHDSEDHSTKLERLRSLAAKSEGRDDLE